METNDKHSPKKTKTLKSVRTRSRKSSKQLRSKFQYFNQQQKPSCQIRLRGRIPLNVKKFMCPSVTSYFPLPEQKKEKKKREIKRKKINREQKGPPTQKKPHGDATIFPIILVTDISTTQSTECLKHNTDNFTAAINETIKTEYRQLYEGRSN